MSLSHRRHIESDGDLCFFLGPGALIQTSDVSAIYLVRTCSEPELFERNFATDMEKRMAPLVARHRRPWNAARAVGGAPSARGPSSNNSRLRALYSRRRADFRAAIGSMVGGVGLVTACFELIHY